jgi:DNA-binding transcriptional regulator YhcF (GntR family)
MDLKIDPQGQISKYQQIVDELTLLIESGSLAVGDKVPSIEQISKFNQVAKETVVKAYRHLKARGIIDSSQKKGFYVLTNNTQKKWRVLVLFNILSPSKELIFKAILKAFKEKMHVDLMFHNNNLEMFENIIRSKATAYHYFIVMPHFSQASEEILKVIPPEKLYILDRPLQGHIKGASSVHQDFRQDVYEALNSQKKAITKYKKLVVIFPKERNLPKGIIEGIKSFTKENNLAVSVVESANVKQLEKGTLFITTVDDALIELIELQQNANLKLGKDIGIISYNDNPLKRILSGGITTISSDFAKMGNTVAELIINKEQKIIHNTFNLIKRKSL